MIKPDSAVGLIPPRPAPRPIGSPLNILYVGHLPPHPGGTAIVATYLLSGLAARRHRVRAVAPITAQVLAHGDAFAQAHPQLHVERYLLPYFFTSRAMTYRNADYRRVEGERLEAALPRLIVDERPELIVAGQESAGWHVPALARTFGLPCALLVHGGTTFEALVESETGADWQDLRAEFESADLVVTVAHHLADSLQRLGIRHVRTIPNAVDLHRFRPQPPAGPLRRQLGLDDGDLAVAHVSSLAPSKRSLDVVDAAALALQQNARLVYLVVGDGAGLEAMKEACRRHRIHDRFRFVGWVEHSRVVDYLNLADVVVMPSEHEGLSLVYLESQACGRVIVASDIPAAREAIVDGETGLLFEKGDVGQLAARILRVAADPILRTEMGLKARKAAEERGTDPAVSRYEEAFRAVAARTWS